ncbi:MAG TPA: hypothetical protein VGG61_05115 [Gemmataceae bacterium]
MREKMAVVGSLLQINAPDMSMAELEKFVLATPEGHDRLALILLQEAKQLVAIDRYERRATQICYSGPR